ncbi:hypothetical protein I7I50_05270 [Histoplasma capsulatum G186AR]|uniref:Uncharacterized protein n=1 Tax=Ajellomyces capsulatus TaxID=5037 RepID=A0A8H7ZA63_AJECA|nr:hypothetical protein I7I52_03529 [Histoplasma capsulatum]QSS75962.1 hypothetical protein I7I50_05270 [Histoplasma capsulatum G186AR]
MLPVPDSPQLQKALLHFHQILTDYLLPIIVFRLGDIVAWSIGHHPLPSFCVLEVTVGSGYVRKPRAFTFGFLQHVSFDRSVMKPDERLLFAWTVLTTNQGFGESRQTPCHFHQYRIRGLLKTSTTALFKPRPLRSDHRINAEDVDHHCSNYYALML